MILKRPIQNIKAYESAISQFENIIVKLGVCGKIISSRVGVKLFPQLEKRNIITVNINGMVQANSLLIAFPYVVSLLDEKNPAEFAFEEDDVMIDHFNKCMKGRFFKAFPHSKHFAANSVKCQEHKFKDQSQLKN